MTLNDPLLALIDTRIAREKEEGDIAYFTALTLKLEYVTKIITAAVVACIGDDSERHRYRLEHQLTRASAIGDWVRTLTNALTGSAAQFFIDDARHIIRHLTERVGKGDWRHTVVSSMDCAATQVGLEKVAGSKVSLRQFFEVAVRFRNRTRGHGATTSDECSRCCCHISDALDLLVGELGIFKVSWVHLHRNLSGKYRVVPLLGAPTPFEYLKKTKDGNAQDGVFLHLDRHIHVPLVFITTSAYDIFLPNGNYRDDDTFETLSYITNETNRVSASAWTDPPTSVPPSQTEGGAVLEPLGNTFANLPPMPIGHVSRDDLEARVAAELLLTDRHPIVSLTGPGGIGKTTTAIASIIKIAKSEKPPYDVIIWISARDIDLLEYGPKPVQPRAVTLREIAKVTMDLMEPKVSSKPEDYLQQCLADGAAGPTLFVLDNFETVQTPADVFKWFDASVRPPNKVLITTRTRNFIGDYPITIEGMTDGEARSLIDQHAKRLKVERFLDHEYKRILTVESSGHPYVIKIFLGQVAREQRAVNPERIAADSEVILKALFQRTYSNISPAGQRVFLLLCSWRVFVPEVAVKAVVLRPGGERLDVTKALEELRRYSLIDEVIADDGEEAFIGVPLVAAMYGRRMLEVSPLKALVCEDRKILMDFGAGKREDVHRGIMPRIERFIEAVAKRSSEKIEEFEELRPVLEFSAEKVPMAYLRLADLVVELEIEGYFEKAKEYLRLFLANSNADPDTRKEAWDRLAGICREDEDVLGEIHALTETALLPGVGGENVGNVANKLNGAIRRVKEQGRDDARSEQVRKYLERVAEAMEIRWSELSATDCSRLAWLYLNIGNQDRALDVAKAGYDRDRNDEHCQRLLRKLDS